MQININIVIAIDVSIHSSIWKDMYVCAFTQSDTIPNIDTAAYVRISFTNVWGMIACSMSLQTKQILLSLWMLNRNSSVKKTCLHTYVLIFVPTKMLVTISKYNKTAVKQNYKERKLPCLIVYAEQLSVCTNINYFLSHFLIHECACNMPIHFFFYSWVHHFAFSVALCTSKYRYL